MPPKNTLLGMTTAEPVSTGVHSNINNLLAQSDRTHLWQKALGEIEKGMSNYKHPDPITGTVPDVALSPLLAAKSIPSMMKLLKKIKLRNPVYHHTSIPKAKEILKTGEIKPTSSIFKGGYKPPKYSEEIDEFGNYIPVPKAFSVTRDPKFLSRPHSNIGTDVRFIMDRDELIRKGYKLKPFAEESFRKTRTTAADWTGGKVLNKKSVQNPEYYKKIYGKYPEQMNPRFEFEERVLGNLPTKDIKLIDWAKIPIAHGTKLAQGVVSKYGEVAPTRELHSLIKSIMNIDKASPQLPLIMSEQVRSTLKKVQPYLTNVYTQHGQPDKLKALEKLMSAPRYKYNPFK